VHKLIGGARVIDAMGVDDRAITLKGTFLSPDADQRALQVDVMRKAGQPVPFAWYSHVYTVVIKSFQPEFQRPDRVPYSLTVEVLQDQTQPIGSPDPSDDDLFGGTLTAIGTALAGLTGGGSLLPIVVATVSTGAAALASVEAAIGQAQSAAPAAALGVPVAMTSLQGAAAALIGSVAGGIGGPILSGLTAALAVGGSVSSSSAANLAAMAAAATQGRALLAPALGFGDAYLSSIPSLGGVVAGSAPAVNAAALTTATAVATALPALRQLDANLGVQQQIIARTRP
jgi:hypothetical protein